MELLPGSALEEEDFHSKTAQDSLSALQVDPEKGLSCQEAAARLARDGPNVLPSAPARTAWERLWEQINSVLIYVLLIGAALSFGFGHLPDGIVILAVIVVNVCVGFCMEGKAESTARKLSSMMSATARVLRDEEKRAVEASELVSGDIFFLEAGDVVPADGRVLAAFDLNVLEAPLTGESHAILKTTDALPAGSVPLAERTCMVFSGTQVIKGAAICLTVRTGSQCEIGKISSLLKEVVHQKTPLVLQLERFGVCLSLAILVIALVALGAALGRGYSIADAFSFAIGIAVAAIPEGLPSCVTITFAIGVRFMAKKGAVIKSLPAVETLGSVGVICSDKTGTLTTNIMTVKAVCTSEGLYELTDDGHIASSTASQSPADLLHAIIPGVFCNDSTVSIDSQTPADVESSLLPQPAFTVAGDPTETCILALAAQLTASPEMIRTLQRWPRQDTVPFDSSTKYMATMHALPADQALKLGLPITSSAAGSEEITVIMVKGAPEKVLSFCSNASAAWLEQAAGLAGRGMRVLGLAYRIVPAETHLVADMMNPTAFTMLSLVGIMDPPRPEAIVAVQHAHEAGITVKMITGDHPATALAIGRMLGLTAERAITGAELDALLSRPDDLDVVVMTNDIFARTTPEHKLRIVQSLQRQGCVCSMTGDGVNDAPALKAANIGVAMGITGTEVAKDAANMVITDDNFATIVDAIRVGRCTYNNLVKILAFVLPTNGGQAFSIIMALVIGIDVPITALQILWVNMVTSITLGLVLAFEEPHDTIMQMPPRRPGKAIFGKFLSWRVVYVSVILVCAVLGNFHWEKQRVLSIKELRCIAVNTLSVAQIGYIFCCRYLRQNTGPVKLFAGNPLIYAGILAVAMFQALFTYAPPLQYIFETEPLDGIAWAKVAFWGALVFLCVESEKWLAVKKAQLFPPRPDGELIEGDGKAFEEL